mmetsp:Transcript_41329/g.62962  ORF Transcript_41329/g.62962 Transcript_41329/m.62962 type:complete len:112 (+) Transcript_41329:217-552(+)|eukprot:CAMPEP_0170481662 /NCGR_PEP_ID=MMETSP0208-20121228/2022_1 /TAXON_ID=197538 /ORGANISM="Strombidium inclinatum, Strain S3" /LENGTH=111 /DNA_ID=CAMNT_0010754409 /DNA_START=2696 /DNA_END=3031 /DNA_ORIENTATION=-
MGFNSDAPAFKKKKAKPKFNASEGRDYTKDVTPSLVQEKKADPIIPEVKSPAQVAAEKAAEWKKQQLEAELARKNKSYIKKKQPGDHPHIQQLDLSKLELELKQLADAQQN